MALRVFIVPELLTVDNLGAPERRPAYIVEAGVTRWGAADYGVEPLFLVAADVTPAQLTTISANADVIVIPANLDAVPTGATLTQTKSALEALHIPAGAWVDGLSYRSVLRYTAVIFHVLQRWRGLGGGRVFGSGVTLNTTIGLLPVEARNRLQAVAQSFGWDYSFVTVGMTIRELLRALAVQHVAPIDLYVMVL